jgi:hypothetical protein
MYFCQRYNELTYIEVTSIKWNITNNNSLKLLESIACICASLVVDFYNKYDNNKWFFYPDLF